MSSLSNGSIAKCFGILIIVLIAGMGQVWCQDDGDDRYFDEPDITQGSLMATNEDGKVLEFPLEHTSVYTQITGFIAEVEVKQHFHNPYDEKIEAVYIFPLPENSAVNMMIMVVGERNIYGEIHKRQEARFIYEQAKAKGKRTALLEQERPNIFTQSVANIQPDEEIIITIRYVQSLKYDRGTYRYVFPMVVGPRYIPGNTAIGKEGTGWSPDTDAVPDASRITPPVLKPGVRSGHDISLTVSLDAGMDISNLRSKSHDIEIDDLGVGRSIISIMESDTIPNKDFVLEYTAAGEKPRTTILTHYSQMGGYLMLIMQPDFEAVTEAVDPKEIFFVVDCSGSMRGYPIQKVKEAMYLCIQGISPDDTFQIIRFSSSASKFSAEPIPATRKNKDDALDYIQGFHGSGGTRMIEGIKACLDYPRHPERRRIVFFMTDGQIGNDDEIIKAIRERVGDTHLFSFGVGSSTNRSLLERMAQAGGGTSQYIRQDEPPEDVIRDMLSRVSKPYMTDVKVDWGTLDVIDVYPQKMPDLFSAQPLIFFARYDNPGEGGIELTGTISGEPYEEWIDVSLPAWNTENGSLAFAWAREKIKSLMFEQIAGRAQNIEEEVTNLALDYNLMSKYTSFVAVDEEIPEGGDTTLPRTIAIPVPMPEGVSFTGVFGSPALYSEGDYLEKYLVDINAYAGGIDIDGDIGVFITGSTNGPSVPDHRFGLRVYAATNGTVSEGDVYRVRNGGPSARLTRKVSKAKTALAFSQPSKPRSTGKVGGVLSRGDITRVERIQNSPVALYFNGSFQFVTKSWKSESEEVLGRLQSLGYIAEAQERSRQIQPQFDALLQKDIKDDLRTLSVGSDEDKEAYEIVVQLSRNRKTDDEQTIKIITQFLDSENRERVLLGLNLIRQLHLRDGKVSEEFIARTTALVTGAKDAQVRYDALGTADAICEKMPAQMLDAAAKDDDSNIRMLVANILADETLAELAKKLIPALIKDDDQKVSAIAIKTGTLFTQDTSLIPTLSDVLLKADPEKRYLAIGQAAIGLAKISEAEESVKSQVQKIFVDALRRDCPQSVGEEKYKLKQLVYHVALANLIGYKGRNAYDAIMKPEFRAFIAREENKGLRVLAAYILVEHKDAYNYLLETILKNDAISYPPALLVTVIQHLREYEPDADFYDTIRTLSNEKTILGRNYSLLRAVLVEALFDRENDEDMRYATSLLKTVREWRIRRTILARLGRMREDDILDIALGSIDDPHPVIRQIALAQAIAATSSKEKRGDYLQKISEQPTPATCDEILLAEGLSGDLALSHTSEIRELIAARLSDVQ